MGRLLVVHHSPTASMRALTDGVLAGANHEEILDVEVVVRDALVATSDDVLAADALLLGTPANFGYMSGALKHFFDSTFLTIGGSLTPDGSAAESQGARMPYGIFVHGRYDLTGAVRSIAAITGALPWRQAAPTLEVLGPVGDAEVEAACELGATLAALIDS